MRLLALLVALVGCSAAGDTKVPLEVAFSLPGGLTIDTVHYTVRSWSGAILVDGQIAVANQHATVSVHLAVPPGTGNTVTLAAVAQPGGVACAGTSAPFAVLAHGTTLVSVTLICDGNQPPITGKVIVDSNFEGDHCPSITFWAVAPKQTSVGGTIDVSAASTDADPTDAVTYAWTPAANFTNPTAPTAQYHCTVAGAHAITLTVSDDHSPQSCSNAIQFLVNCI